MANLWYAKSSDNGKTWSTAGALNTDAAVTLGVDVSPVATWDGVGKWIVVWARGSASPSPIGYQWDLMIAKMDLNGVGWTAPQILNPNGTTLYTMEDGPSVATDGKGNWVVASQWGDINSGNLLTSPEYIAVFRSTNNGDTWTSPILLSNYRLGIYSLVGTNPDVATDRNGNWVISGQLNPEGNVPIGHYQRLLAWHSIDNGATWADPVNISPDALQAAPYHQYPSVAADPNGRFMITWTHSISVSGGDDILFATSPDGGISWSSPAPLSANPNLFTKQRGISKLQTDNHNNWVAMWYSNEVAPGGNPNRLDIIGAYSSDFGTTWTAPLPIDPNVASRTGSSVRIWTQTDGKGLWLASYDTNDSLGGTKGTDNDIVYTTTTIAYKAAIAQDDNFTTNIQAGTAAGPGWYYSENFTVGTTADITSESLRIGVPTRPDTSTYHATAWLSTLSEWLPYAMIGPNNIVRSKNYVYAADQSPSTINCIPNIRLKLQNGSAVASTLEVLATSNDGGEDTRGAELAPSREATSPSLYRVDYDPVDVPYLASNAAPGGFGGVMRAFENYSFYPQMNGNIFLAESTILTYPAIWLSDANALTSEPFRSKNYGPTDLQNFNESDTDFKTLRITGLAPGIIGTTFTTPPLPSITTDTLGVTASSIGFPSDSLAVCELNFLPVSKPSVDWTGSDYASVPRVEENYQYKIRFHVVSSQQSNLQSQMRLRARTNRFLWGQKLEVGGAYPTNNPVNLAIAQQTLPGIGCLNPDTGTLPMGTAGGWYTLILHSPLSKAIRADTAGTISARMPILSAEPGPGDTMIGNTRRMILVGFDLIDTLSQGTNSVLEEGSFTLDAIEVKTYPLVLD
ncbi:MAG: glycoside hydrolase [Candidatus Sumerlaeaceae bacterium]|nr:glycoside hydrolase [Candidatus Sumerlaeaceae bacterium]